MARLEALRRSARNGHAGALIALGLRKPPET
ncbi:hypothetical protein VAB18032_16070 [Micromonospora maris AB-18-032]|nr:hypothetical protein VAB18032_16070 [Micromonospora maris AB-18-032]